VSLPSYGTRVFAEDGRILCHVCGKAFHSLVVHVTQKHGFASTDEYRREFGLARKGLVSAAYRERLRTRAGAMGLARLGAATRRDLPQGHSGPDLSPEGKRTTAAASGRREREKTHCPRGHAYEGANLYLRRLPDGRTWRGCRACHRESERVRRKEAVTVREAS
jgi:hypothetical protein